MRAIAKRITAAVLASAIFIGALAGCSLTNNDGATYIADVTDLEGETVGFTTLEQLKGEKISVLTGSVYPSILEEYVPGSIPVFFNNAVDQAEALTQGKVSAIIYDEPTAVDILKSTEGVRVLTETMGAANFGIAAKLDNTELINQMNTMLDEMKANGELDALKKMWFGTDESAKVLPDVELPKTGGVLRIATSTISPPYVYIKDNQATGYEVAITMLLAEKLGLGYKLTDMDFAAILPAVTTGKADLAMGQICITEERAQNVLFSKPIGDAPIRMVVRDEVSTAQEKALAPPWYQSFTESFTKTFITENRYQLILQGLGTTMLISIFSALFGTALGFGICMMRRSKSRWLSIPAKMFIQLVQGVPIVVILMILFYLVFTSPNANPIVVAVIGFSINFAAYVSEMMRTGIDAVDKGQLEAASAIGFNKFKVFRKITLPQAACHVLPVFKGEFISMIKMTSVVGYIALQDLTKMSDIIRSRTYDAFFPLIATAIIYFLISYLLTVLLTLVEIKVDPQHRKRTLKGVAL